MTAFLRERKRCEMFKVLQADLQTTALRNLCCHFCKVCWVCCNQQPCLHCYLSGLTYSENNHADSPDCGQEFGLHFSGCSLTTGQSHFLGSQWLLCGACLSLPSLWIFESFIEESVLVPNMQGVSESRGCFQTFAPGDRWLMQGTARCFGAGGCLLAEEVALNSTCCSHTDIDVFN